MAAVRKAPPQSPKSAAAGAEEDFTISAFTNQWFGFARQFFDRGGAAGGADGAAEGDAATTKSSNASDNTTVAERLAASDPAFAAYLRRLRDADKTYVSTKREYLLEGRGADLTEELGREFGTVGSAAVLEAAIPPAVDVDGRLVAVRWTHSKWPELVAKEYVQKKRRYGARLASTSGRLRYLVMALVLLLVVLYAVWPVWNFLIDIDADVHYRTLGITSSASKNEIKKAYRAMAKKWHPDSNPGCGDSCTVMMREIQRAHDVLLAKGGKDTSNELKQQYQEAIAQLLAFVFYRGFAMAFNTATLLNYFITVPRGLGLSPRARAQWESRVHAGIKLTVILLFVYFTIAHVTGANLVMLAIGGFRVVSQFRDDSATERNVNGVFDDDDEGARTSGSRNLVRALTLSNFNLPQCVLAFLVPSVIAHVAWTWMYTVSPGDVDAPSHLPAFMFGRFLFQLAYGAIFVCSLLVSLPPNLWDNLTMMECTVPNAYFSVKVDLRGQRHMSVTAWSFLSCEFGFLVDDVFAFVTQIPAPFRVAVYLAHGLYLMQMCTLPWATPAALSTAKQVRMHQKLIALAAVRSRSAGSGSSAAKYASSIEKLWSLTGESSSGASSEEAAWVPDPQIAARKDSSSTTSPASTTEAPLTDTERLAIHNLPQELVTWLDIKVESDRRQLARKPLSAAALNFAKDMVNHAGRHGFKDYVRVRRAEIYDGPAPLAKGLSWSFVAVLAVVGAAIFAGVRWEALSYGDPSSFVAASALWHRDAHEAQIAANQAVFGPRLPFGPSRRLVAAQADVGLNKAGAAPVFVSPEASDAARARLAESTAASRLGESLLWGTKRKKRAQPKKAQASQQQQQQQQQQQPGNGKRASRRPPAGM